MQSQQTKGILITTAGVIVLSPDGLLTTMISVDSWTLIFWRGLLLACSLMLITFVVHRSSFFQVTRAMGWSGIGVGILFGAGTIFFVLSVRLTSIANALFLLSVAPIFGALFSRIFLGERISRETYLTTIVVICGMAVIFGGEFSGHSIWGNAAALAVAACGGGFFVLLRSRPLPDPAPAFALGGLLASLVGLLLAPSSLAVPASDIWPLLVLGLIVLPISFALAGRGPRYLPSPEVNLIMLLEAVLGPIWGILVISQIPSIRVTVGGVIVLSALAVHFVVRIKLQSTAS
jgi:drug/metabolite transporter (DMT)-like permease